jgi:hypothetical protein
MQAQAAAFAAARPTADGSPSPFCQSILSVTMIGLVIVGHEVMGTIFRFVGL